MWKKIFLRPECRVLTRTHRPKHAQSSHGSSLNYAVPEVEDLACQHQPRMDSASAITLDTFIRCVPLSASRAQTMNKNASEEPSIFATIRHGTLFRHRNRAMGQLHRGPWGSLYASCPLLSTSGLRGSQGNAANPEQLRHVPGT